MAKEQDIVEAWFTQMFTTTDYLFTVSTTWQYMIIIPLMLYCLVWIFGFLNNKHTPDAVGGIFVFAIMGTWFIGLAYYGMVLFKIMWASA